MASHPPGECCTVGVKHEGSATGEVKSIGDTSTYFAYPKSQSTDNCILFLTDAFGLELINNKLIADQYAANGYFCVMPDLFHGDPAPADRPPSFDITKWLPQHQFSRVDPVVSSVITALRSEHGVKRIGAVGYCFGAKYVVRFMGDVGHSASASVDAGYMAHPSLVEEDELKALKGPLSISAAENDVMFPADKRRQSEQILKELSDGPLKLSYQVNLFGAVSHGFAVRGDLTDKRVKYAKEQAFIQAVQWFDHFLKGQG